MNISIIIPLYNRKDLVVHTLNSLNQQYHPKVDMEIIVIDDGSTDNAIEMIHRLFPHVHVFHNRKKGAPAARNMGINLAKNEFICLLDSDDLMEPNALSPKISTLQKNKDIVGVYGPWDKFAGKEEFQTSQIIPPFSAYPIITRPEFRFHLKNLLSGWYIATNALIWRKKILQQLKGQNEDLLINQDVEMMFRILSQGNHLMGIHCPKALQREHSGDRIGTQRSESRLQQMVQLRREFWNELEPKWKNDTEIRMALGEFNFRMWKNHKIKNPKAGQAFSRLDEPRCRQSGALLRRI